MKNSKNILAFLALACFSFTLLLTSCGDEENNLTNKQDFSIDQYKHVGQLHNQGLDYVLASAKEAGIADLKEQDAATINEFVIEKSLDFANEQAAFAGDRAFQRTVALANSSLSQVGSTDASNRESDQEIFDLIQSSDISPMAKELLITSVQVFDNPDMSYEETTQALYQISDQAANSLENPEEVMLVQSSISVGIETADYWANGGVADWSEEWGTGDVMAAEINWKDVGKADLKGAISGGLKAIFTGGGVLVGAGIGALAASAAEIIVQLLF